MIARKTQDGSHGERGSAVIEMVFLSIFLFLLMAFVLQQAHFAQDFMRSCDEMFYDVIGSARVAEESRSPNPIEDPATRRIPLRDIPLITSMLDIDPDSVATEISMTAAGGTYGRGSGLAYDLADLPAAVNAWQLVYSNPINKGAVMAAAAGIGYRF